MRNGCSFGSIQQMEGSRTSVAGEGRVQELIATTLKLQVSRGGSVLHRSL